MARIEFKLPDIGEGVAEGEITSWKVKAGDSVEEDQIMVEVMTDKATVEIGAPVTGKIVEIKAKEGDTVPVGDVLVVLSDSADAPASGADEQPDEEPEDEAEEETPAPKTKTKTKTKAKAPAAAKASQDEDTDENGEPGAVDEEADDARGGGADGDLEEVDFALPDIGEGVAEGEITKWMVSVGDAVTEDQPMLEVMTDKATVEIGSPVDGEVLEILHEEGATVPVGETLLVLGARAAGAAAGAKAAPAKPAREEQVPKAKPRESKQAASGRDDSRPPPAAGRSAEQVSTGSGAAVATGPRASTLSDTGLPKRSDGTRRVRAAPAVRRLARESGIDISQLEGSGPQGRVTMDDVRSARDEPAEEPRRVQAKEQEAEAKEQAPAKAKAEGKASVREAAKAPARPKAAPARSAAPRPPQLEGDERVPLRGLRKRIAAQMRLSKQTAAHFAYVEELDVTDLVKTRKQGKARAEEQGVKLTYMPFIIKATCAALREFPILNSSLDEEAEEVVYHHEIHMGVAVDTPNGLIVPVVRDADRKSLYETSTEIAELAERARNGKTRPEDVGGGTFTITNAGNIGGLLATPIINVPEVAIMGVHAIRRRPWVVDEQIVIRDIMYLSLSLDHRVVDGAVGAYFMNRVKELLENPALMLLDG